MILAFLATLLLTVIGLLTIDPLFLALGAKADLLPLIRDYMVIWYLGIVFLIVPLVGMSAIRAMGNSKVSGYVMTGSAILNIILDPLLIFGLLGFPRLELEGAAIATVIARASHVCRGVLVPARQDEHADLQLPAPRRAPGVLAAHPARRPAGGRDQHDHPGRDGRGGSAHCAVRRNRGRRIWRCNPDRVHDPGGLLCPLRHHRALCRAESGAGKHDRIVEALSVTAWFAFLFGLAAALVLALFAEQLAGLFSDSPDVVAVTALYLWIVPISYGAAGIVMVANAIFNGIGLPGRGVIVSVTRMVVLYVPAAYLGAWLFDLPGIFAAAALANLAVGIGSYFWNRNACRHQRRRDADQSPSDLGVA